MAEDASQILTETCTHPVQVITMGLSAIFAGSLFFLLRDEGLNAVWETLLAFQIVRSVLFAYRCVALRFVCVRGGGCCTEGGWRAGLGRRVLLICIHHIT